MKLTLMSFSESGPEFLIPSISVWNSFEPTEILEEYAPFIKTLFYVLLVFLVSPHVRDYLWCKAFQSMAWQNLCSKFLECPVSTISRMLVWTNTPPPTQNADLNRSWHFGLSWSGPPPNHTPKSVDLDWFWHFGLSWSGPPHRYIMRTNSKV